MSDFPAKGQQRCPTHNVRTGYGSGKCPDCARVHAEKAVKIAMLAEDSEDEEAPPAAKRRCVELEAELEDEKERATQAETERNHISVELSRTKLKLKASSDEIAHLKELLELAKSRMGEGEAWFLNTERAAGGAGAGAGAAAGISGAGGRNVQACLRCRSKQQKCDGDGTYECARCEKAGVDCVYGESKKRGPKRRVEE
jgi:hypothetical protein